MLLRLSFILIRHRAWFITLTLCHTVRSQQVLWLRLWQRIAELLLSSQLQRRSSLITAVMILLTSALHVLSVFIQTREVSTEIIRFLWMFISRRATCSAGRHCKQIATLLRLQQWRLLVRVARCLSSVRMAVRLLFMLRQRIMVIAGQSSARPLLQMLIRVWQYRVLSSSLLTMVRFIALQMAIAGAQWLQTAVWSSWWQHRQQSCLLFQRQVRCWLQRTTVLLGLTSH